MADQFKKTARQRQAVDVLNRHRHAMLYGGTRSGKTLIAVRNVFLRALKKTSRHLIVRLRFNHAVHSLAHDTIPWVLEHCFPGLMVQENKAERYWTVPAADGGESEVWLGGTDEKKRVEKILGTQWSTVYMNECSQIPWEVVPVLWTRLAENSGLAQRMYYDCNPTSTKHWTNLMFLEGILPDGTPAPADRACIQINPGHNLENLSSEYLASLDAMPERDRRRFFLGEYVKDVEGALWTIEMMVQAKLRERGEVRKTVIAVDPSVSNNPGSDEWGIVVCSETEHPKVRGRVRKDLSGKFSTKEAARRVVAAYHAYEASCIVAEVNQGGDLVADAIHNVDPYIKVEKVHASDGKRARAEPVQMFYELEEVGHDEDMPKLEAEMTETDLREVKQSPNRLDALVHGLTFLLIRNKKTRIHVG